VTIYYSTQDMLDIVLRSYVIMDLPKQKGERTHDKQELSIHVGIGQSIPGRSILH